MSVPAVPAMPALYSTAIAHSTLTVTDMDIDSLHSLSATENIAVHRNLSLVVKETVPLSEGRRF